MTTENAELVERRSAIRNVLYRNLPMGIDADLCRRIADEILALNHRIEPEAADRGWQLIETAPRGPHLLGFDPRWGVCEILRSSQMADWHVAAFNGQIIKCSPTHWRPRPDPPAIQSLRSEQEGGRALSRSPGAGA